MKIRFINSHVKDCSALKLVAKGDWATPWACPKHVFANARGWGRGSRSWIKWRCNSMPCPAEMMVFDDDILKLIHKETGK